MRAPALTLGLALAASAGAASAGEWGYRIGEPHGAQQGSFCASAEQAHAVAEVFRRFGPRPGYAALAQAPGCSTRVLAFTPVRIVEEITLAAGKPLEYQVRFVEVEVAGGGARYLFTTRTVVPAR